MYTDILNIFLSFMNIMNPNYMSKKNSLMNATPKVTMEEIFSLNNREEYQI